MPFMKKRGVRQHHGIATSESQFHGPCGCRDVCIVLARESVALFVAARRGQGGPGTCARHVNGGRGGDGVQERSSPARR